jgi:GT2 family glycosyltransferase
MTDLKVSVVVVSLNRPDLLLRCLKGVEQLAHPEFEVVVVADPYGLEALDRADLASRAKIVAFDVPNISAARNLGIGMAAGEIIAFIDDDAVPEPSWLRHLCLPFTDPEIVAAGGYVLGRNGISFQSTAQCVDVLGRHIPLEMPDEHAQVFDGRPGRGIKTEGTNCAFRRQTLIDLGGFDPAFRFYMDETDLNMRIAHAGMKTVLVPLAQVHHGFAASAQRHTSRLPRTLYDVGASSMIFLRKHAPVDQVDTALADIKAEQRNRLLRHMMAGTCEPRDVARLLATLEAGFTDGRSLEMQPHSFSKAENPPFKPFAGRIRFSRSGILAGRSWSARAMRREAVRGVASGTRTSVFLFSPTTLFHRVEFHPDGFWEQRGGLFGKSDRNDPLVRFSTFRARLKKETERIQSVRFLENLLEKGRPLP